MSEKELGGLRKRFGEAVRRRRREMDLTQEGLAERCEVHRTYIANIERGKINPSLDKINVIAHALDLSLVELITRCEGEE